MSECPLNSIRHRLLKVKLVERVNFNMFQLLLFSFIFLCFLIRCCLLCAKCLILGRCITYEHTEKQFVHKPMPVKSRCGKWNARTNDSYANPRRYVKSFANKYDRMTFQWKLSKLLISTRTEIFDEICHKARYHRIRSVVAGLIVRLPVCVHLCMYA